VGRLSERQIELEKILTAVGQANVDFDFNQPGFRRKLLKDLARARVYFNNRMDFKNKKYLRDLDDKLADIKNHTFILVQLLKEGDVRAELQPVAQFRESLELLIELVRKRRNGARQRFRIASATWRNASLRRSLNAELVAKLAVIFETNFRLRPSYAREKDEGAGTNTCPRFINAVFKEFGLPKRRLGTIGNDLTNVAERIKELKMLGTKT
jgi:hypothetical protein